MNKILVLMACLAGSAISTQYGYDMTAEKASENNAVAQKSKDGYTGAKSYHLQKTEGNGEVVDINVNLVSKGQGEASPVEKAATPTSTPGMIHHVCQWLKLQ